MKPTKANLECADVIMERNNVPPHIWTGLRRDIALAIDIAERELRRKLKTGKDGNKDAEWMPSDICEVCNEPLKKGEPWLGCEKCGRMYGPCCNSDQESLCVECSP